MSRIQYIPLVDPLFTADEDGETPAIALDIWHYEGMHDQSTHGDRMGGSGGGRYGEPGKGSPKLMTGESKPADWHQDWQSSREYNVEHVAGEREAAEERARNLDERYGSNKDYVRTRDAVKDWTSLGGHWHEIRTEAEQVLRGETPAGHADRSRALMRAVSQSRPTSIRLYRGVAVAGTADEVAAKFRAGRQFDISLGSFTSQEDLGRQFATSHTAESMFDGVERTGVVFELDPGAKAFSTGVHSTFVHESEWITSGRFRVKETYVKDGQVHVILGHDGVFRLPKVGAKVGAKASKHYDGMHDQSTHGDRASSGGSVRNHDAVMNAQDMYVGHGVSGQGIYTFAVDHSIADPTEDPKILRDEQIAGAHEYAANVDGESYRSPDQSYVARMSLKAGSKVIRDVDLHKEMRKEQRRISIEGMEAKEAGNEELYQQKVREFAAANDDAVYATAHGYDAISSTRIGAPVYLVLNRGAIRVSDANMFDTKLVRDDAYAQEFASKRLSDIMLKVKRAKSQMDPLSRLHKVTFEPEMRKGKGWYNPPSLCAWCSWFTSFHGGVPTCQAFGNKIPDEIWKNEIDHRHNVDGDGGKHFMTKVPAGVAFANELFGPYDESLDAKSQAQKHPVPSPEDYEKWKQETDDGKKAAAPDEQDAGQDLQGKDDQPSAENPDPDGDGDDDTTPEGDTDHDYQVPNDHNTGEPAPKAASEGEVESGGGEEAAAPSADAGGGSGGDQEEDEDEDEGAKSHGRSQGRGAQVHIHIHNKYDPLAHFKKVGLE